TFATVEVASRPAPTCSGVPIGSKLDLRSGVRIVTGANRIDAITVKAFEPGMAKSPVHTRTITLDYVREAEVCNATHAATRLLASIQETASGIDSPAVALPPVTF